MTQFKVYFSLFYYKFPSLSYWLQGIPGQYQSFWKNQRAAISELLREAMSEYFTKSHMRVTLKRQKLKYSAALRAIIELVEIP